MYRYLIVGIFLMLAPHTVEARKKLTYPPSVYFNQLVIVVNKGLSQDERKLITLFRERMLQKALLQKTHVMTFCDPRKARCLKRIKKRAIQLRRPHVALTISYKRLSLGNASQVFAISAWFYDPVYFKRKAREWHQWLLIPKVSARLCWFILLERWANTLIHGKISHDPAKPFTGFAWKCPTIFPSRFPGSGSGIVGTNFPHAHGEFRKYMLLRKDSLGLTVLNPGTKAVQTAANCNYSLQCEKKFAFARDAIHVQFSLVKSTSGSKNYTFSVDLCSKDFPACLGFSHPVNSTEYVPACKQESFRASLALLKHGAFPRFNYRLCGDDTVRLVQVRPKPQKKHRKLFVAGWALVATGAGLIGVSVPVAIGVTSAAQGRFDGLLSGTYSQDAGKMMFAEYQLAQTMHYGMWITVGVGSAIIVTGGALLIVYKMKSRKTTKQSLGYVGGRHPSVLLRAE